MSSASEAFNDLLGRLGQQHENFLREACDLAFEALKAENRHLTQELGMLRAVMGSKPAKEKNNPPPIPDHHSIIGNAKREPATWAEPSNNYNAPEHYLVKPRQKAEVLALKVEEVQELRPLRQGRLHQDDGSVTSAESRPLSPSSPPYRPRQNSISSVVEVEKAHGSGRPPHRPRPGSASSVADGEKPQGAGRHPFRPREGSFCSMEGERLPPGFSRGHPANRPDGDIAVLALAPGMDSESPTSTKERPTMLRRQKTVALTAAHDLDEKLRSRRRRRMQALFGLDSTDDVTASHLYATLHERSAFFDMGRDALDHVLLELKAVPDRMPPDANKRIEDDAPEGAINVDALADITGLPNLLSIVDQDEVDNVKRVVALLNITTVSEEIEEATKLALQSAGDSDAKARWTAEQRLATLVRLLTILNVTTMGVSVDYSPTNRFWLGVDVVCTFFFCVEVGFKMCAHGILPYFCGEPHYWNLVDFVATILSVMDLCLDGVLLKKGRDKQAANTTRIIVFLRTFRLVRLVRVTLVQSPVVKDLAKMLVGFVIGLPSLMWVIFIFLFVLYIVGLTFRFCFGPAPGQNYRAVCGEPDTWTDFGDPGCPVHYMYGEEFFGTMPKAMFTTFRFMLGDYSTRGGNSLAVAFSEGYGTFFDCIFVSFMIVVTFGFFNIITAIFVDSTTAGLKSSDSKKKLSRQYERSYVKSKLMHLIARIQELCLDGLGDDSGGKRQLLRASVTGGKVSEHNFHLTHEDFADVMRDPRVLRILEELDVEIFNADGLFDTFDPEGTGEVTVHNLVQAVMRLRGDPQKNDVIGSLVAVRSLTHRFEKFQLQSLEGMARLEHNQAKFAQAMEEKAVPKVEPEVQQVQSGAKGQAGQPARPAGGTPASKQFTLVSPKANQRWRNEL